MPSTKLAIIMTVLILSLFTARFLKKVSYELAEDHKCPYCYGTDYCEELKRDGISLKIDSPITFFNNFLSVKNVYVTENNVVLKKLGYRGDFEALDKIICSNNNLNENCYLPDIVDDANDYKKKIGHLLSTYSDDIVDNFKVCSGLDKFMMYIINLQNTDLDFYKNIWTVLNVNVEPIILQMLKAEDFWPVPKYYGACGRLIAQEYAGDNLNRFKNHDWLDRAYLSLQLLDAAHNFTHKHRDFGFYLTDISSDNIAVDGDLKLRFIDLENIIVVDKSAKKSIHQSEVFETTGFAYSEKSICDSYLSDHNYFAVCMLLLWDKAPWPMMEGGLLHSMPEDIKNSYPELNQLIDLCVQPIENYSRFNASLDLMDVLREIIFTE